MTSKDYVVEHAFAESKDTYLPTVLGLLGLSRDMAFRPGRQMSQDYPVLEPHSTIHCTEGGCRSFAACCILSLEPNDYVYNA